MNSDVHAPFMKIGPATLKRVANENCFIEWEVWHEIEEIGAIQFFEDGSLHARKVNRYGDLIYSIVNLSSWVLLPVPVVLIRFATIAILAANGIVWSEDRSTIDSIFTED
jgi:hypothetical protein